MSPQQAIIVPKQDPVYLVQIETKHKFNILKVAYC